MRSLGVKSPLIVGIGLVAEFSAVAWPSSVAVVATLVRDKAARSGSTKAARRDLTALSVKRDSSGAPVTSSDAVLMMANFSVCF